MPGTHFAARWEDELNRRTVPYLKRRGWRPRTISYIGYGSPRWIRVLARVVLGRHGDAERAVDQARNLYEVAEAAILHRGWRSFFSAPAAYLPVEVELYGARYSARTDRNGYLDLTIPGLELDPGWHQVIIHAKAAKPVSARIHVIGDDARFGIVSDIDDTVMVTSVPRPMIAVWNTFIRHGWARKVVPGMAELYAELQREYPHAPVFYLSTGAWNIMPTLFQVLRTNRFPRGAMLMTDWGPTNTGWFRSGRQHKHYSLRRLQAEFPHIRWYLFGDDGQHDPQIYREFADEFPHHTAAIAIRELSPGEQVLSHGSLTAPIDSRFVPSNPEITEVTGADGHQIAKKLLPKIPKINQLPRP